MCSSAPTTSTLSLQGSPVCGSCSILLAPYSLQEQQPHVGTEQCPTISALPLLRVVLQVGTTAFCQLGPLLRLVSCVHSPLDTWKSKCCTCWITLWLKGTLVFKLQSPRVSARSTSRKGGYECTPVPYRSVGQRSQMELPTAIQFRGNINSTH